MEALGMWVLIVMSDGHHVTELKFQEFTSRSRCETAQSVIASGNPNKDNNYEEVVTRCVPK